MDMTAKETAQAQALAQVASIKEMVAAMNDADGDRARDDAEQAIHEDALSVEVRTGWYPVGVDDERARPAEFMILLCTGGPAVRIVGSLSHYGEPDGATLECQDWFQPWTRVSISDEDEDALLAYARCFYFGEG